MLERLRLKLEGSGTDAAAASAGHRPGGVGRFQFWPDRLAKRRCRTPVRSASRRHRHPCRKAPCRAPVAAAARRRSESPTPTGIVSIAGDVAARARSRPRTRQAQPRPSRHAPLPAQRRLHPGGPPRRPGCAHRRPGPSAIPNRCCCARGQRDPAQPVPRAREGVLHRRRRLRRRKFRARLHPHRVAVVRHPRRHGHRRAGEGAMWPARTAKTGMRGRLVSQAGQILANALLAGVASGIGHAFTQSSTTLSVSPLGTTSTVDPGKAARSRSGTGVGKAWTGSPSTTSASPRKSSR